MKLQFFKKSLMKKKFYHYIFWELQILVFDEDLSGYWRFNAGNKYIYDFSGNLNHGEILGADWVLLY